MCAASRKMATSLTVLGIRRRGRINFDVRYIIKITALFATKTCNECIKGLLNERRGNKKNIQLYLFFFLLKDRRMKKKTTRRDQEIIKKEPLCYDVSFCFKKRTFCVEK